jgi:hypothetical protein
MGDRTRYEPGTFCWVGLATSDPDSAKAFYTSPLWLGDPGPVGGRGRDLHDAALPRPGGGDPLSAAAGGAAVVTREPNGRVDAKSEVGEDPYVGTASGGMIGLLVGIVGGPIGVLLGGATGVLVGSLFDIDEVETTESVLSEISKQVEPTRTAVLAQVTEQSPEVIDAAMGGSPQTRTS